APAPPPFLAGRTCLAGRMCAVRDGRHRPAAAERSPLSRTGLGRPRGAAPRGTTRLGGPGSAGNNPHRVTCMRFGVLGPLAVWTDSGELVTVPGTKVRALLADLLVHEGRPVSADRLVDDLWGDDAPANPLGALQVRVSQLRKALEDAEPGARNLLVSKAPGYLLAAEDVDAVRFAQLLS